MSNYQYASPAHWLIEKLPDYTPNELRMIIKALVHLVDSDELQNEFQSEMEDDGYFESETV